MISRIASLNRLNIFFFDSATSHFLHVFGLSLASFSRGFEAKAGIHKVTLYSFFFEYAQFISADLMNLEFYKLLVGPSDGTATTEDRDTADVAR